MKFIKIATISFLAGNAAVAAAHSHIPTKECIKAAKDLHMCVLKVIADDATGAKATAWENVITEAQACMEAAAGDDKVAQEACAMPVFELSAEDCPSGFDALLTACAPTSFEFEDFVLDLAEELEFERFAEEIAEEISEELEGAAFWEGEEEEDFIAKKVSKKCENEGEKGHQCIKDTLAENTKDTRKWGRSLEKAVKKAESCVKKAVDEDAKLECASSVLDIVSEHCSMKAYKKACKIPVFMFEDFTLDLAEELEDAAFWEGAEEEEFIAKKVSKKCENQGAKIHQCIKDTIAKDTKDTRKWGRSLEKAAKKAESCAKKAVDEDAKLECASSALDIIDEHCSLKALRKACKIPAFMFEDFALDLAEELESTAYAYGLRGSTVKEE